MIWERKAADFFKEGGPHLLHIRSHGFIEGAWQWHILACYIFLPHSAHCPYFSCPCTNVLLTFVQFPTRINLSVGTTRAYFFLGGASLGLFLGGVLMLLALREFSMSLFLWCIKLNFFLGGLELDLDIEGTEHHLFPRGLWMHLAVACCPSNLFDSRQKLFSSEQQSCCCCLCCC